MAIEVQVEVDKTFTVNADYDTVFALVADVPRSAGHFPKIDQLVDTGDNTFRWEMEKIGVKKYYFQTVYACKYTDNHEEGWVKWTPVQDVGNAVVSGSWHLTRDNGETGLHLKTNATMHLPFPGVAGMVVKPFVSREFTSMVDTYIENLKKTLNT